MAIRFKVGTIPVECDTADEASLLLLGIAKHSEPIIPDTKPPAAPRQRRQQPPVEIPANGSGNPADLMRKWFSSLESKQQKAMKLVRDASDGITTEVMGKALGCERGQLKYAIRSIRSSASKMSLNADSLLDSQEVRINGEKGSRYTMTAQAREALAGID